MKLRSYKEALQDADAAVEADGTFAKGFLRRAAANEALENFDDAVRDYEKVYSQSMVPPEILDLSESCAGNGKRTYFSCTL